MGKRLYVIDGHWQIFRAYYAPFRPLTAPTGEPTKATYVFSTMLLKLIGERRPDYLAVALDSGREYLKRTRVYPEYKAQRAKPPEDLPGQIARIVQIVGAMGIPILQKIGAEADDIMATLVQRLSGGDVEVVLVSRDKDLDQVVGPGAVLYDPINDETIDAAALEKLKGYPPAKAVEVQSLCGDSTDNVPGIPGVGPKTAAKLIAQYGSAEAVLAHAAELKGKLGENVRAHAAEVALTRQLVTLERNVPLELDLDALAFRGLTADNVRPIFAELGFKRLIEQIDRLPPELIVKGVAPLEPPSLPRGAAKQSPPAADKRTTAEDFDYRCVDTPEGLEQLARKLAGVKRLAVDTETTDISPVSCQLVGVSLAWQPGRAVYLPVMGPLGAKTVELSLVREKLAPILADAGVEKIAHNLKYDAIVLAAAGMPISGPTFDTILASYVLQADRGSYSLNSLGAEFCGHDSIPIEDLLGKGAHRRTMNQVPVDLVTRYSGEDADLTFRLSEILRVRLHEEALEKLFERIEMALVPVLVEMERNGIRVDPSELNRQRVELSKQAETLRGRIVAIAGASATGFNPDSPRQLAEVLFEKLKLPVLKRTKTGPSTDVSVLTELAALHEAPALVLEYRQLTKLLSTYLVALGQCINARTGRVHTSFNQTGTVTGRLSSSDPNLQNIPVRTDLGRRIRAAFVAEPGNVLISADYSQVELRILAHLSGDPTLLAAFQADQDIHRIVAAEIFRVPPEQVSAEQRGRAKTVNFGIIYGQTAFGLAATLRIGRREAQEFIDAYKARFPKIEEFLETCVAKARADGYVETLSGRRRRIEGFDSDNPQRRALAERLAINSVVQGSAADLIKIAMIDVHAALKGRNRPTKMLLQIHDELLFESPQSVAQDDAKLIQEKMSGAMKLSAPLKVDIGVGPNWRDAK